MSEADIQARAFKLVSDASGGALVVEDASVDAAFAAAKVTLQRRLHHRNRAALPA